MFLNSRRKMKKWVRYIGLFLIFIGLAGVSFAQGNSSENEEGGSFVYSRVINGNDTLLASYLPMFQVFGKARKAFKKQAKKYNRLRNAVYVTYPYARIVSGVLKEVDGHLATLKTEEEKKAYLSFKEKELKESFGPKIKDLSMYQGKVLIKLIYRETGSNTYDLIRQLRGGFSARFWQTVAFVFGGDLKEPYDVRRDSDIENFVREIEYVPFYRDAYYHIGRFH